MQQKLARGAVEERLAHHALASRDTQQALVQQALHHARRVLAANLGDLRAGDRLAIRHDGQRLQRRPSQAAAVALTQQGANVAVVSTARHHAVAAGQRHNLYSPVLAVRAAKTLQRRLHLGLVLLGHCGLHLLQRHRVTRGEQQRLENRHQSVHVPQGR